MYVIQVERQDGFTGYVYETSLYGNKYLDAPKNLSDAKKWKSFAGAQKNKEKFLKDRPDAGGLFQTISIKEIDEQDLVESDVQIQEKRLHFGLEHLRHSYSSDSKVEKPMMLKLAELLISAGPGDTLRYYSEANTSKFELAPIDSVVGETLWVKGQEFRRIDGNPVNRQTTRGRVMPEDERLCDYLLALRIIEAVAWSDMPPQQIIQVAQIINQ